jgi:vanillate O-demethylase ferredoxin subunit
MMSSKHLSVRVSEIRQEAIDIASFSLVSAGGGPLPAFEPGAHIDVHLPSGLVRQYSLINGPGETERYVIAVKRDAGSRGGSAYLHDALRVGDLITIGEPRNHFPLDLTAEGYLLIAGGIGVTPILSMARHLLAAGKPFQVLYFTRSIKHTAFHEVLSSTEFANKVHFHYAIDPKGIHDYLRRALWERPQGGQLYLCGPQPFMELVQDSAAPTWPPQSVHLEYFSADPAAFGEAGEAFEVVLARSGGSYQVPEGRSIVDVLAEQGITIETSCEQGICGTCLTGVLEGEPDHRDMFLTDEEQLACDKLMPCVSRAKSRKLVLDL